MPRQSIMGDPAGLRQHTSGQERRIVFAHRGASRAAPQNSLLAVRLARTLAADGAEVDVQRCGTGEVVVFHDERLDRLGLAAEVAATPLAVLRRFELGGGERIPTLEE